MKKLYVLLVVVLLSACAEPDSLPTAQSDSDQSYKYGSEIPVDDNVYQIEGEVVADVNSLTSLNAQGDMSGAAYYGGYGYITGSYAMWQEGKGFVRLRVTSTSPSTELARPGTTIIIKTTDQKIRALLPGDRVVLKCRLQYEAIAAVRENETLNVEKVETWEIDYCRMASPRIDN